MDRQPGRYRFDSPKELAIESYSAPDGRRSERRAEQRSRAGGDGHSETPPRDIIIMIPVFNDWGSLSLLLPRLDAALASRFLTVDVFVIDDGSTEEPENGFAQGAFPSLRRIDVLRLRRNLGHQRAIAVGLAYLEDSLSADVVLIMDGDGEDDPADVPRLLERLEEEAGEMIVFAERARRSESVLFRIFYGLFKLMHVLLTGKRVRVGNFSAIPRRRLSSLVVVAELWNHYAAAVFRSHQPYCMIPTRRARRLSGSSTMNFVSLVTHGLSAISVYSDVVGVRLLVMAILMAFFTFAGVIAAVSIRFATNLAIPGWANYTVGILLILFVQAIISAFAFSFVILGSRHGMTFLPRRDYGFFIGSVWTCCGSPRAVEPEASREGHGDAILAKR
jgi:glycosyltransferase involved in cell wall biosynthesis